MSTNVTMPTGEFVSVQGYDIRQSSGGDRTVVVDDQGAVHIPPLVPDSNGEDAEGWFVREILALGPWTRDPDPIEDPLGFVLRNGQWVRP